MSDKSPLSVVILTKNEAARIAACLRSVLWADDILVVDDESTDDTVRIAESLGARVLRRKMDLEGRHRNWANAQAKHEWVLTLDADERVTPELAEEIQRLLANGSAYETYAIPRRNYIGTRWIRHGGWYPSAQLRLFKNAVFRWEETTVHCRAISDRPWGTLSHDVIHYSYRDLRDFVDKMNRQTTLEAQKWIADVRRVTFGKAAWRAADRFLRAYVGKRGYRDGFWGFIVAVMGGMYQLLAWIKYWEQQRAPAIEDVIQPFQDLTIDHERYDRVLLMSHLCAYRLAARYAGRKRVLEVGSGTGYGAYYLGHVSRDVTAVDLDWQAVERAQRIFQRPNVWYLPMNATQLAFADRSFDVVGSFQVIERIPEPRLLDFLNEIARVLQPDGVFVVSTLNLAHHQKGKAAYQKPGFHEKEFLPQELEALLRRVFPSVELYGLYPRARHRLFHRLKKWGVDRWGSPKRNLVRRFYGRLDTDEFVLLRRCSPGAIDLIGVCRTDRRSGSAHG